MSRKIGIITLIVISVVLGGQLFAQEAEQPFMDHLRERLQTQDWTENEIGQLIRAARAFRWEGVTAGDAEIVAMALQLGKETGEALQAGEQVMLAYELAQAAGEMRQLGFRNREIAQTALECTRDMLQTRDRQRAQIQDGENAAVPEDALAEQFRSRIRSQIRSNLQDAEQKQVQQRTATAEGSPHNVEKPGNGIPAQDGQGRE